jgi:hypothetical protein
MTHDPLQQLLCRADAVAETPTIPAGELVQRVRAELHRRQIRARLTGAGVLAAALLAVAITVSFRTAPRQVATKVPTSTIRPTARSDDGPTPARLAQRLAALRSEADARESAIDAVLAREARARATPRVPQADPLAQIAAQRDLGAMALVRQADRRYRETGPTNVTAAVAAYGRVLELFPNTRGATVARQRLSEIGG